MKTAELRAKSREELTELVLNSKKELFNLRMQASTGALENRSRFSEVRKTVARAKTILNEKPGSVKPKADKAPKAPKAPGRKDSGEENQSKEGSVSHAKARITRCRRQRQNGKDGSGSGEPPHVASDLQKNHRALEKIQSAR